MKKLFRILLAMATTFLLVNCINVEMETVVKKDRSGSGKLVYSWAPDQNVEQIDMDETFKTIQENPTVHVTGSREYQSEGKNYKEITWTFTDINTVELEGLTYSYMMEDGKPVLRAIFEEPVEEPVREPEVAGNLHESVKENNAAALDDLLFGDTPPGSSSTAKAETGAASPSSGNEPAPSGSLSGGQGLTPQEQMAIDEETQAQMEEMINVMIRAALEGFSVKFRFSLPHEVLEAPGAEIDGTTATWDIPLKELVDPGREGAFDEFRMVMKPE